MRGKKYDRQCTAKSAADCFNCPFEDCRRHTKVKGEDEFLKLAKLPVHGGIFRTAEDLKYSRSERLI